MPRFLDPENSEIMTVVALNHKSGVICYAAIDERTHFSKYYFSNLTICDQNLFKFIYIGLTNCL